MIRETRELLAIAMTIVLRTFIAVMAVLFLAGALRVGASLDIKAILADGEGWNAYHATAAMAGRGPYPADGGFFYNNYPPLSFYLVGAAGWLTGDNIIAGRILSLAVFLVICLGLAGTARTLGSAPLASAFGTLMFAVILLFDYEYVGINDPQMLGHAFGIAGLWLALGRADPAPRLWAASFFFAMAFFIKHNLVIGPLAALAWLFLTNRRAAIHLAGSGIVFALCGIGLFQFFFGTSLWSQLASPRLYYPGDAIRGIAGWLEGNGIPLAATLWAGFAFRKDEAMLFCLVYLGIAFFTGAYFNGGAGTGANVMFDAQIALALSAAIGLDRLRGAKPEKWDATIYATCFLLPVLGIIAYRAATDSFPPRYWLDHDNEVAIATAQDIAMIAAQPGPVICEKQTLCYWAGKAAELDTFNMGQAILTGRRDGSDLAAAIAAKHYTLISGALDDAEQWPPRIAATVRANYRQIHSDALGQFWVPR